MSEAPPGSPTGRAPVITPARVVVAVCLLAPFAGLMWVGSYAKVEPALLGLPFFYWYQMLWVPISAVLTVIAYRLVRREEARRKAERAGGGEAR